jgi:parallel beta-helix repeat protein
VGGIHVFPGQNLQAKIDAAPVGATLLLHAGTYQSFDMRANRTVQAAGDGAVVVTGGTGSWDAGIWVKDAPNVTIRGLTIRGNTLGIFLRNSPGAIVEGNVITDNAFGLEIHATTTGTVIRGNRIVQNDRFLDSSRKAGGMNLMDTSGGITVVGNTILGNDAVGIEIYGMDDAVIDSNIIGGSADAIETGTRSGGDCKNNKIVRNLIYQTNTRAEERGMWLRCMSQSLVAHNVIDSMDKFGIGVVASGNFSGPVTNLRIVNNVVVNGRGFWLGTGLPSSVVIDYNDVVPCTSGTCEAFGNQFAAVGSTIYLNLSSFRTATGHMAHGLSASPAFVNAGARDYRLTDGSPLIDRGVGLGMPYSGSAPDIGRHER